MNVPEGLHYTSDHEWARVEDAGIRIGITDFAQDALGDVVFVELPALGSSVTKGGPLSEVESTKSVSQIYAPATGTVVEVNAALRDAPETLNSDPYGDGWLCVIEANEDDALAGLMDADGYRSATEG